MLFQNKKLCYTIRSLFFIYYIYDTSLRCISKHMDLYKHPDNYFHVIFFTLLCFREVRFQKSLLAVRIWDSVPKLEEELPPPCPRLPAEQHPPCQYLAFHHSQSSLRCPVPSVEDHQDAVQGFSQITHLNTL